MKCVGCAALQQGKKRQLMMGPFAGKFCIELGCGTGMVGVALARAGASPLLLTDGNAEAVGNCRRNLALNGVEVQSEEHAHGTQVQWHGTICVQNIMCAYKGMHYDCASSSAMSVAIRRSSSPGCCCQSHR